MLKGPRWTGMPPATSRPLQGLGLQASLSQQRPLASVCHLMPAACLLLPCRLQAMDGSMSLEEALEQRLAVINCTPADIQGFLKAHPAESRLTPVSRTAGGGALLSSPRPHCLPQLLWLCGAAAAGCACSTPAHTCMHPHPPLVPAGSQGAHSAAAASRCGGVPHQVGVCGWAGGACQQAAKPAAQLCQLSSWLACLMRQRQRQPALVNSPCPKPPPAPAAAASASCACPLCGRWACRPRTCLPTA